MKRRWQRAVAVCFCAFGLACASHRIPASLRRYDILVEPKDLQSLELAYVMRRYGFHVRETVRGGNRPTAALIYFIYSDPGAGQPLWLHVRLADTRSGTVLRSGSIQLDSSLSGTRARAFAAVDAILAP